MASFQRALLVSVLGLFLFSVASCSNGARDEESARAYLNDLDRRYSEACNTQMTARWNYIVDVTPENEEASTKALNEYLQFQAKIQAEILTNFTDWADGEYSEEIKREFRFLAARGPGTMDQSLVEEMNGLMATMESAYATAKVCTYAEKDNENCEKTLSLEPDIEEKLRTVTDYNELAYYWTAWHDAMRTSVSKTNYNRFIQLQNTLATSISDEYKNMGDLWAIPYDDGSQGWTAAKFEDEMLQIWETLRPNYEKLHAYVRMKLRQNPSYREHIKKYGQIPANLLGNMWAQDWTALDSSTKPFPNAPSLDATQAMIEAGYNATTMFRVSDEFFTGLGLKKMTDTFWEKSMLEKPTDREVVCHASAEDFCLGPNSEDFRIKMCTNVNQDDLVTVHHEMGHIEYFMQYTDKHYIFRDGANPGFHEAIGDALALAVTTPSHLQCELKLNLSIPGLCDERKARSDLRDVSETDINFLYYMALQKYSFFPFAISMDSWRWGVFDGSITSQTYNSKWWEIRNRNQGIIPPMPRDEGGVADGGLDAAAKYHIVANVEYIRYFVSHILQFQFYESLCIAAGEYDPNNPDSKPLYQCDFAGSVEAGAKFEEMMQLGFSKPWPEALEAITGSREMNTNALNNYFAPLFTYIDQQLEMNGEATGWTDGFDETDADAYVIGHYEAEMSRYCTEASVAEFEYQTDLNNPDKEAASTAATLAFAKFESDEFHQNISKFDYEKFTDQDLKRTFKFLNAIGTSKLTEEDLQQYTSVLSEMSKIYGTAKVCPFEKQDCDLATEGLNLEPDLTQLLAKPTPETQDALAYYWAAWRSASGKKMRALYQQYVQLSNKAAMLNDYDNMGDFWLLRYESDTFRQDLEAVWQQVNEQLYKPFYAYVRYKLKNSGFNILGDTDPIPAHILGNMWSQSWEYIMPYVTPYPNETVFDITEKLKNLTSDVSAPLDKATILFNMANSFFNATGLEDMTDAYGDKAMIVKPDDGREVICHASAWDMCDKTDFRIKMCTEINQNDFITIHHELGHIQYYKQYKDLQYTHRTGANPGFHEAIGDVLALSVSSPKHLKAIGLLPDEPTELSMLNYLMQQALDKVAFLPFGYLIDSYRWRIFNGDIADDQWTYEWIKMRGDYQGVVPPVVRSEYDFDPGAKYHVPANTPYIRYFVSYILQFQIQQKLCQVANHTGPLYNCDIYENAEAGKLFADIMKKGASKPWTQVLQETIGTDKLNASAIIEYFQPLLVYINRIEASAGYDTTVSYNPNNYYDADPIDTTIMTSSTDAPPPSSTTDSPISSTDTEPPETTDTEPPETTETEPPETTETEPPGTTETEPPETTETEPPETTETEPPGTTESEPTGETDTEPTGETDTEPTGTTESEPTGETDTEPTGTTESEPTGETDTVPTGETDTVPTGETDTVPTGETDTVPTGATDTIPTGETDTVPTGETDTVPTGATDTVPTGETDTVPTDETDTAPTGATGTVPTASTVFPTSPSAPSSPSASTTEAPDEGSDTAAIVVGVILGVGVVVVIVGYFVFKKFKR